ncbi:hypothetical protein ACS5PK_18270 [Roseateles sp. DB2]|uniref:hypothetical protein n=1 Tax=Roseateles sp. DB2 TaxID=3453717 RepID=UPI003EE90AD6
MSLQARPYSAAFRFVEWRGACRGSRSTCELPAGQTAAVLAVFAPVSDQQDLCAALGLQGGLDVRPLNGSFPQLAPGEALRDPQFGTTLRRVTDVRGDGRGSHRVVKTLYSTVSAWNADESLLLLYRTDGGPARHELYDGHSYAFLRALDDIRPVDLEQVYWDTQDPDLLYYSARTDNTLYRYRVSQRRSEAVRVFTAQCGSLELHGGSDPLFNDWQSRYFGYACTPNGSLFSYDLLNDRVGRPVNGRLDYGAPQVAPSGQVFLVNENDGASSGRSATVRDPDMQVLRTLDLASGNEHGALSLRSDGLDTWNAVAFDAGPGGSGIGTVVSHVLQTGQWRVLVGPSRGYPYPPSGTHIGATAFHRRALLAVSVKDDQRGDSLLDSELLFIDSDPLTNPAASVCRVGHHRSMSDSYWAEPHPAISPSGTRIAFSSSWGDASRDPVVNVYVLELPGYRRPGGTTP